MECATGPGVQGKPVPAEGRCRAGGFGGTGPFAQWKGRRWVPDSLSLKLLPLVRAALGNMTEMEALLAAACGEAVGGGQRSGDGPLAAPGPGGAGAAYVFAWTGRDWKVVFAGGRPFFLPDTRGTRYLDYLLHHPNVPISAFDLDGAVNPERVEARCRHSIQPESDARACAQYREALRALRSQRGKAESMGDREALEDIDGQIQALEHALGGSSMPDAGERAYDTVRHAIRYLTEHLRGSPEETQFAEHLRTTSERRIRVPLYAAGGGLGLRWVERLSRRLRVEG